MYSKRISTACSIVIQTSADTYLISCNQIIFDNTDSNNLGIFELDIFNNYNSPNGGVARKIDT